MKILNKKFYKKAAKLLKQGEIGILATDTIYGILGLALSKKVVAKIYKIRQRNLKKPSIILISSLKEISLFDIKTEQKTEEILKKIWPGKISVILPYPSSKFKYLHCGTKQLAFRIPKSKRLLEILKITGPLIAPSANPEGLEPAKTIKEAKKYFGEKIDFYLDNGKAISQPSTLIKISNNKIIIKRKGADLDKLLHL